MDITQQENQSSLAQKHHQLQRIPTQSTQNLKLELDPNQQMPRLGSTAIKNNSNSRNQLNPTKNDPYEYHY